MEPKHDRRQGHTHKTGTWYVFKISHFVATPSPVPVGVPALQARALSIRLKLPVLISRSVRGPMVQTFKVWKTTSLTDLLTWNFSVTSRFKSQIKKQREQSTFYRPQQQTYIIHKPQRQRKRRKT